MNHALTESSMEPMDTIYPIHVEVRLVSTSSARLDTIRELVKSFIQKQTESILLPSILNGWQEDSILVSAVERIAVCELPAATLNVSSGLPCSLPISQISPQIHVYACSATDEDNDFVTKGEEGEDILAASDTELPNRHWEGLWESLIYPDDIKSNLLNYIYTTVVFSNAGVDFNVVSWNRVVLLHGPPGTGKTSLCRALGQKLSIRLSNVYSNTRLLEINSHSLFSRWFSESGKLVQKLFGHVADLADDEATFVVVLIDEVESLTAARAGALAGNEPSDALRVVNALLTQLDKLARRRNVLIMATSNLASAIDTAFVDRADIVQYIGLPPRAAVYGILGSLLQELMSKGIVATANVPPLDEAIHEERSKDMLGLPEDPRSISGRLLSLAAMCVAQEMSGRALRRLPVLAHAKYISTAPSSLLQAHTVSLPAPAPRKKSGRRIRTDTTESTPTLQGPPGMDVHLWFDAMERVVGERADQRGRIESSLNVKTEPS